MRGRNMLCACCGGSAGHWQQWWNRDTGYGLCGPCVPWLIDRGMTPEELERNYGKPGIHYPAPAPAAEAA